VLLDRVRTYMLGLSMVNPGDGVVVAVSGGPDSTALLHLLWRLSGPMHLTLHVFHMDHGLRGAASAGDAEYVRRLAESLELPCTVVTLPAGALKQQAGSLQAKARSIRYAELRAAARRAGASRIALGHNRNDQAETVLMRFLRGAGPKGLAGIPPVRAEGEATYVRPLLGISRGEIDEYCRLHELSPRLDESNREPDYTRNRLRLQLIPQLQADYNPALTANLSDMADVLRAEDDLLEQLARQAFDRGRTSGEGVSIPGSVLLGEPLALARRIVRMAAREVAGPEYDLGLDSVTRVLELAARIEGSHTLDLPRGLRVVVEYGLCRFLPDSEPTVCPDSWALAVPGTTVIPELGIRVSIGDGDEPDGPWQAALDADRLRGPLAIRRRKPGDRLWPTGMEGTKKLQDILVDAKVPRRLRDQVALLVAGAEVVWAIGYRLDRRFRSGPDTQRSLLVRVEPVGPKS